MNTTLRTSRWFWFGVLLLGLSGYPLLLMAREVVSGSIVSSRYRLMPVYDKQTATLGSHRIVLEDDAPSSIDTLARVRGAVRIMVDGTVQSILDNVEIRPAFRDANRYHGFVALIGFEDSSRQQPSVAVVVNAGVAPDVPRRASAGFDLDHLRFRLIVLNWDGHVTDETFFRKDRGSPLLRAALARFVSPTPMGYHSDLMMVWPTLLYPYIFPWGTGAIGGFCMLAALLGRTKSRHGA